MPIRMLLLALLLCLAAVPALPAQTTVRVVNLEGMPIPYAIVSVGSRQAGAADSSGRARLRERAGLQERVTARRIGYRAFSGLLAREDSLAEFVVVLPPVVQGLDTVRTSAERSTPLSRTGFYDRMARVQRGAILGEFITPEELEQRRPGRLIDVFRGANRYVTVRSTSRGTPMLLGRRDCRHALFVDGVQMRDVANIEEVVTGGSVMGVEIYPSTANAPAELIPLTNQSGDCGIIAVWTGSRR